MNDNQNAYVREGRTTSRVLAPSGGQSSLTFGLLPAPIVVKPSPPAQQQPIVVEEVVTTTVNTDVIPSVVSADTVTNVSTIEPTTITTPSKQKFTSALLPSQQQQEELEEQKVSQNAFVSGSNMNGGCVMTGRPSSRVLAPPGGHTSIKLG